MSYIRRRSRWVWRSLQRQWLQAMPGEGSEEALVAISAALVVTLVVLVITLAALAVSTLPASSHPSAPTPLTAGTLLLGGASLVGGTS
jgi:hypothetical protein